MMLNRKSLIAVAGLLIGCLASPLMAQDTDETRRKLQELERRLQEQQKEIEQLKSGMTKPAEGREEQPKDKETITATFKDGLKFKSGDGNFEGHIGGRLIEHARFVFDRPDHSRTSSDTFYTRELFLNTSGTLYKQFEYKIEADFPTGSSSSVTGALADGFLGWKKYPEFSIRVGQFKEPFSQEDNTSALVGDFVERSVVNRLVPSRDIGIAFYGKLADGLFQYTLGFFNGQGKGVVDGNDEKDIAARLYISPFKNSETTALSSLRVGVMGTFGDQDSRSFSDISSTETATTYLDFDSGVTIEGNTDRIGLELSWQNGPFGLRGEYFTVSYDMKEGVVEEEIEAKAWYLSATYLLTGETKPLESRVTPKKPFDITEETWGAFELAARLASVDFDEDVFDEGFAAEAGNSNQVTAFTLGINWYLNRNVRAILDWTHHNYDDDVLTGGKAFDDENAILMRFQLDF